MTDPLFDIVIPVKERSDWLELCLTAVRNFTPKAHPYRLILIDNLCKEPATLALFTRAREGEFGSCTILPGQNKSFSNSINMGVAAGKAPNIVVLNSDAIVTEGWSAHFLSDLADKKIGITGARSNAAAGLQGGNGVIFDRVDPGFLVFVCVAMRRETFEHLEGMDEETFRGFGSEDLDLSFRVKKAGGRLKVSNAYVLHGFSRTLEKEVGGVEARRLNDEKWSNLLVEKHGQDYVIDNTRLRPRVLVACFSAEEWTRVDFAQSLFGLRRGTAFDLDMCWFRRQPIHIARQSAVDSIFAMNKSLRDKNELPFSHLCFIDDDAAGIPPDALMKMLAHNVDVVGVVAYQRGEPYLPCVFCLGEDEQHVVPVDIEGTGLRRVDAIGMHMTLFKVSVFERLREFPVEQAKAKGIEDKQELQKIREKAKKFFGAFETVGEDIRVCEKIREAGMKIHADGNLVIGHIGQAQVVNGDTRRAFLARQR